MVERIAVAVLAALAERLVARVFGWLLGRIAEPGMQSKR